MKIVIIGGTGLIGFQGGGGRRAPRRGIDRGNRAAARERLLPGQGRAGEADREVADPVLARARDAVLRVHPEHADAATDGGTVRIAPVLYQPLAGDDVAKALGEVAAGSPLNGRIEIAGPERFRMDEFFRDALDGRPPDGAQEVPAMLSRLVQAHETILVAAHDAAARAQEMGDDGTNDLLVSDVIRTGELQAWFLIEHLVDTPLIEAPHAGRR